ncbi:hypothetical protein pipiens_013599 [Culex pipiens pipiens]|uniref:Uncharacterized protein n=1 Tax=Culex pipiens pipiens TaxID=38569 RepID=A0ABD1CXS0_CULPP
MVKRLKAGDHLDAWMQENHRRDDAMWKISFSTVCMVEETNLMIVTIESRRNISRTSSEFDFNKKHPAPSCPTGTGLTFSDSLAHPVATGTWSRILFSTCPISTRMEFETESSKAATVMTLRTAGLPWKNPSVCVIDCGTANEFVETEFSGEQFVVAGSIWFPEDPAPAG